MMDSNKTFNQQQTQHNHIHRYFNSLHKYDGVEKASQKAFSLIRQGRLNIQCETPFPIETKKIIQKPERKAHLSLRISIIKPLTKKSAANGQISIKNRRYVESLIHKYRVFDSTIQKNANSQQAQALSTQIFEKISHYESLLRNSPQRLPVSQQQKQFIEQSTYNMRLAHSISQDEAHLKEQARKFNCSLHRKNKYYDCLQDIRKKIHTLNQQPLERKPLLTEGSESTRKTVMERRLRPIVRPDRQKGKAYLNFSKQVGVESKEIYEKQRGNVRFVKEVVHHWWSDNESQRAPTVQSSLT